MKRKDTYSWLSKNCSTITLFSVTIVILIIIFLIWYIFNIWTYQLFNKPGTETIGTFGDKFGALNTLFSGFAFAGILIALWMQRKDLDYQSKILQQSIKEMQNQINESKEQTEQFKIQNRNMEIQKIESTFFNLLREYQNMIKDIQYYYNLSDIHTGYRALLEFDKKLCQKYSILASANLLNDYGKTIQTVFKKLFFDVLQNDVNVLEFSKILRSFRAIRNYLESRTNLENKSMIKEYYLTFIRNISEYEVIILFFYGMMDENKDLKEVFNKYGLFQDFNNQLLTKYHDHPMINNPAARAFYDASAYE